MKIILLLSVLFPAILAKTIFSCEKNCLLDNGCVCASEVSPLESSKTPQFVLLTIDETLNPAVYQQYETLLKRVNPDGNPIGATFFVHHLYTDYEVVNKLYQKGYEIGSHTITNNYTIGYWHDITTQGLIDEFLGQKQIISKFANIPISDIKGARMPLLELVGDKNFEAYQKSNITYDDSWASLSGEKLFPYTLDHVSSQSCLIGECPTQRFPGFWISPLNNLKNQKGVDCNNLVGCQINGTVEEMYNWFVDEFTKTYEGERAPFKLIVNTAWFAGSVDRIVAFEKFLEYLGRHKDVFIVTESQLLEWRKHPVEFVEFNSALPKRNTTCNPVNCQLYLGDDKKNMRSCVACPEVYPWLNNPFGMKSFTPV